MSQVFASLLFLFGYVHAFQTGVKLTKDKVDFKMMDEALRTSNLKVVGAWTKAGIGSCVQVQGFSKSESILLDCGLITSESLVSNIVLITHGHIDHIGACIGHARARSLSGSPASYYVPQHLQSSLNDALKAFEQMEGSAIRMNIVPVSPGDEIVISKHLSIVVIPTIHRVESQGYAIFSSKKGTLLPEYRSLDSNEIKKLKQSGTVIVSPDTKKLELVYTGDTSIEMFKLPQNAFILSSPILITELTYIDGDRSKSNFFGHIHLDDVIENAQVFDNVKEVIFVHFSQRYSLSQIVQRLQEQLPLDLQRKVRCSLFSFGAKEYLTSLSDPQLAPTATANIAGWGWGLQGTGPAANQSSVPFNETSSASSSIEVTSSTTIADVQTQQIELSSIQPPASKRIIIHRRIQKRIQQRRRRSVKNNYTRRHLLIASSQSTAT